VLSLDSDSIILQPMDELFLLPSCPVAMPRAYWLYPELTLSSQVMLIQPSNVEFERIMGEIDNAGQDDYDMEIANELYKDSALILPHRPYNLLTGEFGRDDHVGYLGSDREEWDPVAVYNEAKFIHFSDWPVPKPWLPSPEGIRLKKQPKCSVKGGIRDCSGRDIWNALYEDFRLRRKVRPLHFHLEDGY
jgi:alpha-N-acetylglucosamine transferase